MRYPWRLIWLFGMISLLAQPCLAVDEAHWSKANQAIERGIDYLRTSQNADGSWTPEAGPAITALALAVMLEQPNASVEDPVIQKALNYVLSKCQPDGGIHDNMLENYNTAICLSALARVNDLPGIAEKITKAQQYLGQLQWSDQSGPTGDTVDDHHPFFGGAGYGKHGRPDMSNTQIMLEGLYQSGMDCNDPIFKRALVFVSRCQGTSSNTAHGDQINQDGGFIYATSVNKDLVGVPQSMASPEMIDEAKAGRPVTHLRTYGSMTYAGFKSYLYAQLDRDDPRVVDVLNWIEHNYSVDHNPGMPESVKMQGYYYYLITFSKALDAWGAAVIETKDGPRNWAHDLIDQLSKLQAKDGSWVNEADRWMEGDKNLVTAYALASLTHAAN